jgi:excisionase family DNA binding protein
LSRTTLYAEMASGRLRSVTIGRRRFVPRDAIDDFIAGLPAEYRRSA